MLPLHPNDEEVLRHELAERWNVPIEDIADIRVTDWIVGEVLVSFHSDRPAAKFPT